MICKICKQKITDSTGSGKDKIYICPKGHEWSYRNGKLEEAE